MNGAELNRFGIGQIITLQMEALCPEDPGPARAMILPYPSEGGEPWPHLADGREMLDVFSSRQSPSLQERQPALTFSLGIRSGETKGMAWFREALPDPWHGGTWARDGIRAGSFSSLPKRQKFRPPVPCLRKHAVCRTSPLSRLKITE
jgi:hypothetical protein